MNNECQWCIRIGRHAATSRILAKGNGRNARHLREERPPPDLAWIDPPVPSSSPHSHSQDRNRTIPSRHAVVAKADHSCATVLIPREKTRSPGSAWTGMWFNSRMRFSAKPAGVPNEVTKAWGWLEWRPPKAPAGGGAAPTSPFHDAPRHPQSRAAVCVGHVGWVDV